MNWREGVQTQSEGVKITYCRDGNSVRLDVGVGNEVIESFWLGTEEAVNMAAGLCHVFAEIKGAK